MRMARGAPVQEMVAEWTTIGCSKYTSPARPVARTIGGDGDALALGLPDVAVCLLSLDVSAARWLEYTWLVPERKE